MTRVDHRSYEVVGIQRGAGLATAAVGNALHVGTPASGGLLGGVLRIAGLITLQILGVTCTRPVREAVSRLASPGVGSYEPASMPERTGDAGWLVRCG